MVAKFLLFANQRDDQAFVTGRRKPVGWIFCPMVFLVSLEGPSRGTDAPLGGRE
jgi:hypothetical protein